MGKWVMFLEIKRTQFLTNSKLDCRAIIDVCFSHHFSTQLSQLYDRFNHDWVGTLYCDGHCME